MKYRDFVHQIDVEAWEDAIGFERLSSKDNEDIGYCLDPWGQHQHGDRTGKLAINYDKRLYNCWVCGGGTLLTYTMALKDMDEAAATAWLLQFTRPVEESSEAFKADVERLLFQEEQSAEKTVPYFNSQVIEKWLHQENQMSDWLESRGISIEIAQRYKLGFNPDLTMRHFTGRAVVFPHFWQSRLVGWQSRWLDAFPKDIPKYVFTHDFPRESSIYGLDLIDSDRPVVVCESVPTVLFLVSLGHPAVATFGASITEDQIKHLRALQQGVIIAADNDKAGDKFERLLIEGLERYIDVRVAERVPGDGGDFGDLVEEPKILEYLIEGATIPGI